VVGVLTVAWVAAWFLVKPIYGYLNQVIVTAVKERLGKDFRYDESWRNTAEPFLFKLKFSFFLALIIVLPYIVLQIWGFIAPALKSNEQRPFKKLAPASTLLFLLGAGLGWLVTPTTFSWFASYAEEFPGTSIIQEPGTQVFFVLKMLLAFGVAFQLPLIVFGLGIAGLLSADTLLKYWRHGASAIFVISMIITPSQDPISMLMMAIPLTILFIGSVYAVKFVQRKKVRIESEENVPLEVIRTGEPIAVPESDETSSSSVNFGEPIARGDDETQDHQSTS